MKIKWMGNVDKNDSLNDVRMKMKPLEPRPSTKTTNLIYDVNYFGVNGCLLFNAFENGYRTGLENSVFYFEAYARDDADIAYSKIVESFKDYYGQPSKRDYFTMGGPEQNMKAGMHRITDYIWEDGETKLRFDYYFSVQNNRYVIIAETSRI